MQRATSSYHVVQRFYIPPARKILPDAALKLKDQALEVDLQVLKTNSKALALETLTTSLAASDIETDGAASTPVHSILLDDFDSTHALAVLRFMYDEESLSQESIELLAKSGDLPGVLRLAFSLGCVFLPRLCTLIATSETVYDTDLRSMFEMSSELGLEELQKGYLNAVAKKVATSKTMSREDAMAAAGKLGNSTELLNAALASALTYRILPSETVAPENTFIDDNDDPNSGPSSSNSVASFPIKNFDLIMETGQRVGNLKFKTHGFKFEFSISVTNDSLFCYLRMDNPPPMSRAKLVDITIRAVNPQDRTKTADFGPIRHVFFDAGSSASLNWFGGVEECRKCIATDGTMIMEIASMKFIR